MKNKIIKIVIISFVLLMLIFGVPIIINELYKSNSGYTTIWGASEVLEYYGTILAAIGGVLGVFFTLKYSQKQYRDDARQQIMPFISTDFSIGSSYFTNMDKLKRTNEDSKVEQIVFICTADKGIKIHKNLPYDKIQLIKNNGSYSSIDQKTGAVIQSNNTFMFIPCAIKNVGAAVSLKTTFGLYKLENNKYTEPIDKRKTSLPIILDKGECFYVGLFFDLDDATVLGTYRFDIMYSDMNYTRYRRSITIQFEDNPTKGTIIYKKIDTATYEIYSESEQKERTNQEIQN